MRVLFMGRKPHACEALRFLVKRNVDVVAVVAEPREKPSFWSPKLIDVAESLGLPVITDDKEIYRSLETEGDRSRFRNLDLVLSFLYWRRIRKPLISAPRMGCLNFHAAITPPLRGVCGYSFAIYLQWPCWGATAHFINDEEFDTGDIIRRIEFPVDMSKETAFSLEQRSQPVLLQLFKEVIEMAFAGPLPRVPQDQLDYPYCGWKEFEELKLVRPDDSPELIDRKIRAAWFPPYEGATVVLGGNRYTLVNQDILNEVATVYRRMSPHKPTA